VSFSCRQASASDIDALLAVHRSAFSSDVEADLVASLLPHASSHPAQSWVAEDDRVIVGHVLLTPGVVARDPELSALLLCPLAVVPDHQNSGVGSLLISAALDAAAAGGVQVVNVFGDPDYYERFGFRSLLPHGPLPPFDVSAKHQRAWQTLVLADDRRAAELVEGERIEWADPLMTPELWEG